MKTALAYIPLAERFHRLSIWLAQEAFYWPVGLFYATSRGQTFTKKALAYGMKRQCNKEIAEKIIPTYAPGCKRICRTDDYIPALGKSNVELVSSGLADVKKDAVVDANGKHYQVDAVIYATGFKVGSIGPVAITGSNGNSVSGTDFADKTVEAYLGTSIPDFPNMFMVLGPNSGIGHNSAFLVIETQVNYIVRMLCEAIDNDIETVEVSRATVAKYYEWLWPALENRVWTQGGCNSWYLNKQGKAFSLYPGSTLQLMYEGITAPSLVESYKLKPLPKNGKL